MLLKKVIGQHFILVGEKVSSNCGDRRKLLGWRKAVGDLLGEPMTGDPSSECWDCPVHSLVAASCRDYYMPQTIGHWCQLDETTELLKKVPNLKNESTKSGETE